MELKPCFRWVSFLSHWLNKAAASLTPYRFHILIFLQFTLQEGDVVVMASDGLFDNIWDEQVKH